MKVNGYRIELGEIEAAFTSARAEWLEQAIAVVRHNQLVIYLKPTKYHGKVVSAEDLALLKERVSRTLTTYMLPK